MKATTRFPMHQMDCAAVHCQRLPYWH